MESLKPQLSTETLVIKRTFNAPRDSVFRAWTEADAIKQWFACEAGAASAVEIDLRIGGTYRIEMTHPDEEKSILHGTYQEILPPERLVFTWILDGQHCDGDEAEFAETCVTVEFEEKNNMTIGLNPIKVPDVP